MDVASFFAGLEMVGPGVSEAQTWRPWQPDPVLRRRAVVQHRLELGGLGELGRGELALGAARALGGQYLMVPA